MFLISLLFLAALALEGIGTYISVIGLAQTFASDPIILIMAVILDVCKIIAVNTLAKSWSKIGYTIRTYLITSTIVLSIITSAGVAGYLSNSFQKAMLPNQGNDIALVSMQKEQERLYSRKQEIDKQIAQLPPQMVKGRERLARSFKAETEHINKRLIEIDQELPKLQSSKATLHSEVGAIMYLAELANITPTAAVGIIIALIIFVFDPMAIIFLITANSLLRQRFSEKKEPTKEDPEPTPDPEPPTRPEKDETKIDDEHRPTIIPVPLIVNEAVFKAQQEEPKEIPIEDSTPEDVVEAPAAIEVDETIIEEPEVQERIEDPVHWPFPIIRPYEAPLFTPKTQSVLPEVAAEETPELEVIAEPEAQERIEVPEHWPFPTSNSMKTATVEVVAEPEIIVESVVEPSQTMTVETPVSVKIEEPTTIVEEEPPLEVVLKEILKDKDGSLSEEERKRLDRALDRIFKDDQDIVQVKPKEAIEETYPVLKALEPIEAPFQAVEPEPVVDVVTPEPIEVAPIIATEEVEFEEQEQVVEVRPSLLEDDELNTVPGSKVEYIGPVWLNPKLKNIYGNNK